MTKFSVITACFNSVQTIQNTFDSVFLLTKYFDIEHIFIDGGSTDGTQKHLSVFSTFSHCHVISDNDHGIFDAMNKGASLARGNFLLFLNSDDRYSLKGAKHFLSSILSQDQIVYGDIILDDNGVELPLRSRHPKYKWNFYNLPIHHPSSAVRRDVFFELNKFNLSYRYSSDFDFFLRAFINRVNFRYIQGYVSVMASGGAGSDNKFTALKEQRRSLVVNKCFFACIFAYIRFFYQLSWQLLIYVFGNAFYRKWRLIRSNYFKDY